ncbi:MAG: aminodeoxychorismate synthase component I [Bacteroidota bacterium]
MTQRVTKKKAISQAAEPFGPDVLRSVEKQPGSVLLESSRRDRNNFRSFLFQSPLSIIETDSIEAVEARLCDIDSALREGFHVAGFLSYEAGLAFEKIVPSSPRATVPLLWFGVYKSPIVFDHRTGKFEGRNGTPKRTIGASSFIEVNSLVPSVSEQEYSRSVSRILEYIRNGDTYQVNYTFKLKSPFVNSASELYMAMRQNQRVGYAAFINTGRHLVASASPELFFSIKGRSITLKPMKGTAPRGRTTKEDKANRALLDSSEKDRAENLMIVDLLRNDVGRIAETGSVHVNSLFDIERLETVHQATSTITARLERSMTMARVLKALFPSGSVTGAPKIRTMQIVDELEREPRGVYTGAVGFFSPDNRATMSVAIRTLVIDPSRRAMELGIGSGITAGSNVRNEYEECLSKARFLTEQVPPFALFETLRWTRQEGWFLEEAHLDRMEDSAIYFGFRFERRRAKCTLMEEVRRFGSKSHINDIFRTRISLERNGTMRIESSAIEPFSEPQRVGLAQTRTNSSNRFLFHKTTNRPLYDLELEKANGKGWFDVIFLNERDEVTEGARSNVVVNVGGEYFTPPVGSGILPGTYRQHLLMKRPKRVLERVLRLEELRSADEVYLCNAVRGMVRVTLVPSNESGKSSKDLSSIMSHGKKELRYG